MVQKLQFLICKQYSEEWLTIKKICNLSKVQWFKCTSTVIPLYIFAVQLLKTKFPSNLQNESKGLNAADEQTKDRIINI